MRILYVHTVYMQSMGGEDTTVDAEAELLRSKGHEVRVHLFYNAQVAAGGVIGKFKAGISAIYNASSASDIQKVAKEFLPDVVHVHNFFFAASPSILIAIRKLRIPLITTIQNYRLICANCLLLRDNNVCELCVHKDFPWYGVKYKCYHNSAIQSALVGATAAIHKWSGTWRNCVTLYITPSDFMRRRLIDSSFNVPAEKIEVKRNFIADPGVGKSSTRKNYFLFVGRLSTEKGIDVLIKTWGALTTEELIVVGDGPNREEIVKKIGSLANVQFVGHKSKAEVINLMKNCRSLIFPSVWYEGLPLTIVEALATGTPVIGSDLGAVSEMIQDGKNGLLFDVGSAESLEASVQKFNRIISGGDYSFYDQARETYLQKYHPEKCYKRIMEVYTKAISANSL